MVCVTTNKVIIPLLHWIPITFALLLIVCKYTINMSISWWLIVGVALFPFWFVFGVFVIIFLSYFLLLCIATAMSDIINFFKRNRA